VCVLRRTKIDTSTNEYSYVTLRLYRARFLLQIPDCFVLRLSLSLSLSLICCTDGRLEWVVFCCWNVCTCMSITDSRTHATRRDSDTHAHADALSNYWQLWWRGDVLTVIIPGRPSCRCCRRRQLVQRPVDHVCIHVNDYIRLTILQCAFSLRLCRAAAGTIALRLAYSVATFPVWLPTFTHVT